MTDTQFERLISVLERQTLALETIDDRLQNLIVVAEDGGCYIPVDVLDSEDDEDDE